MKLRVAITWINVVLFGMMLGIETVFIAVFVGNPKFESLYPASTTPKFRGMVTACFPIAGIVGCALKLVWTLTETCITHSRMKRIMFPVTCLWLLGSLLTVCVPRASTLFAGRFLRGMALGALSSLMPLDVDVSFGPKVVNAVLYSVQGSLPLGIVLMSVIVTFAGEKVNPCVCWGIAMALVGISIFLIPFSKAEIDRSPEEDEEIVLVSLTQGTNETNETTESHMTNVGLQNTEVTVTSKELINVDMSLGDAESNRQLCAGERIRRSLTGLFLPEYRRGTLSAAFVQMSGQLTGINVIIYYIVIICQMAGLTERKTQYVSLSLYVVNLGGNVGAIFVSNLVDNLKSLKIGTACLAFGHFLIFILMHKGQISTANVETVRLSVPIGATVLALCHVFVLVFAVMISGPSLVYTAQLLPKEYRGPGLGLTVCCNWAMNALLAGIAPILFAKIRHYSFLLYFIICGLLSVGYYFTPRIEKLDAGEVSVAPVAKTNTDPVQQPR